MIKTLLNFIITLDNLIKNLQYGSTIRDKNWVAELYNKMYALAHRRERFLFLASIFLKRKKFLKKMWSHVRYKFSVSQGSLMLILLTFALISSSLISFFSTFSEVFSFWAAAAAALASSFSAFSLVFCSILRRLFSSLQSENSFSNSLSSSLEICCLSSALILRTWCRTEEAETSDATLSRGSQAMLQAAC